MSHSLSSFQQILKSLEDNPLYADVLKAKRISDIFAQVCKNKGFSFSFTQQCSVAVGKKGIAIHAKTATLANKIKQIQPSLDHALRDNGIYLPIYLIDSAKYSESVSEEPSSPIVEKPIRKSNKIMELIHKSAQAIRNEKVRNALINLGNSFKE